MIKENIFPRGLIFYENIKFFQIVSGIAVHRGVIDTTVSKLQPLESVTDLTYFSKIWLYGGTLLCAVTFLGFWGADAESRMGLITVINTK